MKVRAPRSAGQTIAEVDRPKALPRPRSWTPARALPLVYCAAIVVSAFLLFQVQPLMGNIILPRFGGSASVWGVCLVFFQTVLLAGYSYAHLLTHAVRLRYQLIIHIALLALAAMALSILPGDPSPQDVTQPTARILLLLLTTVGLPYLLLSSTSPLLQAWFAAAGAKQPYGLYALSNLGSMLGLLSYPFVVQPLTGVQHQAHLWSAGFVLFFILTTLAAMGTGRLAKSHTAAKSLPHESAGISREQFGVWFGLSACSSAMLLATTNVLCMDVAPAPFLWVVPLSLYLLTMIICFGMPRLYSRRLWAVLAIASLFATAWAVNQKASALSLTTQIALFDVCLFAVCMMCHGELVQQRPPAAQLTWFYLASSLGGAVGGISVAIVAPQVFTGFFEYQTVSLISVMFGAVLLAISFRAAGRQTAKATPKLAPARGRLRTIAVLAVPVLAYLAILLGTAEKDPHSRLLARGRDFYGVVSIYELNPQEPTARCLLMLHGRIRHGMQLATAEGRRWPRLYFHADSGVGQGIQYARAKTGGPLRVGVVGLGCGTLAAYGQAGDTFRFYEISPLVIDMAQKHFTYLSDSPAQVDCVLGDGRIALQNEPSQQFDVLVIDAFSGDAIPLHLLTQEAMDIYMRHLKPDGILAFHITNNHVELTAPVHALAQHSGLLDVKVVSQGDVMRGYTPARWHLLTRDQRFVQQMVQTRQGVPPDTNWREPWSDDTCNLLSVLR